MKKKCNCCNILKPLSEFHKDNSKKDGVSTYCKYCRNKQQKEYVKNNKALVKNRQKKYYEKYPWMRSYRAIKYRCNNSNASDYKYYGGRGIKCLLTKEDIKKLWFRDKAHNLKRPSIDRKDNDGNYTLENCRYIEMLENVIKMTKNIEKAIIQFNLNGNFIKEWDSTQEASRLLKVSSSSLRDALKGRSKTCKNFIWKYK